MISEFRWLVYEKVDQWELIQWLRLYVSLVKFYTGYSIAIPAVYLKASQVEIITAMKVMSAPTLIVSLPKHLSKIELDAVILKLGIDGAYEYAVLAVDGASMYGV